MQVRKDKCKSFKHVCEVCAAVGHYGSICRSKEKTNTELGALSEQSSAGEGNFCKINMTGWGKKRKRTLPHTAYDEYRGWVASRPESHPELPISASVCLDGYDQLEIPTLKIKNRKVVRFDAVVLGEFWGRGKYTGEPPKGRFPLAISFTLADGSDVADQIPPQASRGWVQGYIR